MQNMKKIPVDQLAIGMYVGNLDRPWLETPFIFQGFRIENAKQIDEVKKYCEFVFVDPEKSKDFKPEKLLTLPPSVKRAQITARSAVAYPTLVSISEEFEVASEIHHQATTVVHTMYDDVRMGKGIDTHYAKNVVSNIVDSIVRNPNAQVLLTQLKSRDAYTAEHSLNVCIFSLAFGRHMGLPKESLNELGLGALLHDLGKIRVPLDVLNKPGKLTEQEYKVMKRHPLYGRDILSKAKGLSSNVTDIALSHHERINGAGYPYGLTSDQISQFVRMVTIVDTYDAMTSNRVYHDGMNAMDAMRNLYDERNDAFDQYLVEEFIKCLGIYPVGSIVELSGGDVGIVVATNHARRLKPKVMMVRDKNKTLLMPPRIVDLALFESAGQGGGYTITRVLDPVGSQIDVRDYLDTGNLKP